MTRATSQAFGRTQGGPPPSEGTSGRIEFTDSTGNYSASLDKTGVLNRGGHFFHSMFIRCDAMDELGAIKIAMEGGAALFRDSDLRVEVNIRFGNDGYITTPQTTIVIRTDPVGAYTGLGATLSVPTQLKLQKSAKNGLWISWYYNINDSTSFRLYFNGCSMEDTGAASRVDTTAQPSGFSAYGAIKDHSPVTDYFITHQWFTSEADGSVIGDPDFRWNFVDPSNNYAPKDLGNGTLLGVTPHFYLSCATHPLKDEVSGEYFVPSSNNSNVEDIVGSDDLVRWYGEYKKAYVSLSNTLQQGQGFIWDREDTGTDRRNMLIGMMITTTSGERFGIMGTSDFFGGFSPSAYLVPRSSGITTSAHLSSGSIRNGIGPVSSALTWTARYMQKGFDSGQTFACSADVCGTTTSTGTSTAASHPPVFGANSGSWVSVRLHHLFFYGHDESTETSTEVSDAFFENDYEPVEPSIDGFDRLNRKPGHFVNAALGLGMCGAVGFNKGFYIPSYTESYHGSMSVFGDEIIKHGNSTP